MTDHATTHKEVRPLTVAAASVAGTTVEYYDFFIYGTAAALVLPQLFFSSADPFIGTLAAFATFAVGYLARPLGGLVFGHFGDRVGRKPMLAITLLLMGAASIGIGLLPTYGQIGVAAPILLVLLRLVQGFAFGGETGAAVLMAYEFAPPGRRGFFASLPQIGPAAGVLLGNAAFLPVAALPDEALYSWGWRVPFLVSIALVAIGVIVRSRIPETPQFERVKQQDNASRIPVVQVLREHPREVLLIVAGFLGFGTFSTVAFTYMLSFASTQPGADRQQVLTAVLVCTVVQLVTIPLSGILSDRFGRGPVTVSGAVGGALGIPLIIAAVQSGNLTLLILAYVFVAAGVYSLGYGALFALFVEAFGVTVRYSGLSLGYQVSNVLGSGLSPLIAATLLRATGAPVSIAVYVAITLLISAAALAVLARRARSNTFAGSDSRTGSEAARDSAATRS